MIWSLFWWVSIFGLFLYSISAANMPEELKKQLLHEHEIYRIRHHVLPLEWKDSLRKEASHWLNTHRAEFEYQTEKELGINLWSKKALDEDDWKKVNAVDVWYSEIKFYPQEPFEKWRQFTQLVWKGSKYLGCAKEDDEHKLLIAVLCYYDPHGNVKSNYSKNVFTVDGDPWDDRASNAFWIFTLVFLILLFMLCSAMFIYALKFTKIGEEEEEEEEAELES